MLYEENTLVKYAPVFVMMDEEEEKDAEPEFGASEPLEVDELEIGEDPVVEDETGDESLDPALFDEESDDYNPYERDDI